MRKTDKKIDNQIREILTEICETEFKSVEGFDWLTHRVDYGRFPESLRIVCVFTTDDDLAAFRASDIATLFENMVAQQLQKVGVVLKSSSRHWVYDTQQRCDIEHSGQWAKRLLSVTR